MLGMVRNINLILSSQVNLKLPKRAGAIFYKLPVSLPLKILKLNKILLYKASNQSLPSYTTMWF